MIQLPAGQNIHAHVLQCLSKLTAEELEELDAAVTPEVAFLLTKAFGPEIGALVWPLIAGESCDGQELA